MEAWAPAPRDAPANPIGLCPSISRLRPRVKRQSAPDWRAEWPSFALTASPAAERMVDREDTERGGAWASDNLADWGRRPWQQPSLHWPRPEHPPGPCHGSCQIAASPL